MVDDLNSSSRHQWKVLSLTIEIGKKLKPMSFYLQTMVPPTQVNFIRINQLMGGTGIISHEKHCLSLTVYLKLGALSKEVHYPTQKGCYFRSGSVMTFCIRQGKDRRYNMFTWPRWFDEQTSRLQVPEEMCYQFFLQGKSTESWPFWKRILCPDFTALRNGYHFKD